MINQSAVMRFVLSLILICRVTGFLPVTSDVTQAEAYNSEVTVQLKIPTQGNFTTDISSTVDILALKGHLRKIFGQHDARIMLRISGKPDMELINSAAWLAPNFFHQQVGKGGQISNQINVNQSSSYHPLCMYETVEDSISGIFNLCTGVNGYFIYNLNSRISIKTVLGTKGQVKQMVAQRRTRNLGDSLNGLVDLGGNMPNSPLRQKRQSLYNASQYAAVYLIADYEYYESVCDKNYTECVEVLYRVMKPVCIAFKRRFDLQIYIIGVEVWSNGNQISSIPNSRQSYNETRFHQQSLAIKAYVNAKNLYEDLILYFANSGYIRSLKFYNGQVHGNYDGYICSNVSNNSLAMIDVRYEKTMSLAAIRTITALLGGKPVHQHIYNTRTNLTCACTDRKHAKCFMSVYDPWILEGRMSSYDWGQCNTKLINNYLSKYPTCLAGHPGYDDDWAKCGNGNLDSDEDCEFGDSEGCCSLDCKMRESVQCAAGDCCNTRSCQRYSRETVCREAAYDCDAPEVCDGNNNDCPADEIRCVDGVWSSWNQWGLCHCPSKLRSRSRECDNPPAKDGGKSCQGANLENQYQHSCVCTTTTERTTTTALLNPTVTAVTAPEPNIVLKPSVRSKTKSKTGSTIPGIIVTISLLGLAVIVGVAIYHFTRLSKKKPGTHSDVNESYDLKQKKGKKVSHKKKHHKRDLHNSDQKRSHGKKGKRSHGKRESKIEAYGT